jgi:hypothetical protein
MKQGRDVNALAFDPDDTRDPRSKHFIAREGSRNRGLEVSFDADRHKCAAPACPSPEDASCSASLRNSLECVAGNG